MLTFLTMAAVTDIREMKISNRLIVSGLIFGLACRIIEYGSAGAVHFFWNVSIPVILLFFFFRLRALGAGDIKLFSVAGGFLTTGQLMNVMLTAFLAAAIVGSVKLVYLKYTAGPLRERRTLIHFSIEILIAYLFVVWGCAIE